MPSTRDIRRRIKSVKNTSQITRAMQLVAASKMKKAQDQALAGRSFAESLNRVINNLKDTDKELSNPLLEEKGEAGNGKELVVVINTDKGLCGGLNTNLLRQITNERTEKEFAEAKRIANFVSEQFVEGEYDNVRVAFTNFVNTLAQEPALETLLPVNPIELGKKKDYEGISSEEETLINDNTDRALAAGYLFEPGRPEVLDVALPMYINYQLYQMILEARASEHSARMVAMKSATDNAKQMLKDLTLEYNKLRQAAITNELLEITTAMKALE